MRDINKLAVRLRELSELYIPARHDPESYSLLQTAASELQRLDSALREHMAMAQDAVSECDKLLARIAELERQPIRWRPVSEAPQNWSVDGLLWSDHYRMAFMGGWGKTPGAELVDLAGDRVQGVTHFAEIVGPGGEPC